MRAGDHRAIGGFSSSSANTPVSIWLVVVVLAVAGGGLAASLSASYLGFLLALVLLVAVFFWRGMDPFIPFLLLVAAMQGGNLLQVSLGSAPVSTMLPFLGGWVVLGVFVNWRPNEIARPIQRQGRLLALFLIALTVIVALTGIAQVWRADGGLLSLVEILTLVQLAVLVFLAMYLLNSPRRVLWMAYITIATGAVLSVIALAGRFGVLASAPSVYSSVDDVRASGLVGDPNYFSFQLLISLGFAASVSMAARTTRGRILGWSMFVLILAGIVSTYSAGALVGVVAVLGGTILLQFRVSAKRALAAFVLIAIATAVVAVVAPPSYRQIVQAKYEGVTSGSFEEFGTGRGAAWEAALSEIASNPLLGVGLGGERTVRSIADYYTHDLVERKAAHNMYLGMAVGTGVLGLGAFLLILASCFSILWSTHRRAVRQGHDETVSASACLLMALLVVATQGLTISIELEKFTWLIIGACLAVGYWPRESSAYSPPVGPQAPVP